MVKLYILLLIKRLGPSFFDILSPLSKLIIFKVKSCHKLYLQAAFKCISNINTLGHWQIKVTNILNSFIRRWGEKGRAVWI